MTELWIAGASLPGRTAAIAQRTEQEGWDGWALVDSQNLAFDPYVHLGLAAAATSTLKLATGVTNPLTRHPAAAAAAIATVHAESGGRAVLGIGRGDSSLAHLGLAPASPAAFERYLVRLQSYLRGEEVPFDTEGDGAGVAPPAKSLGMADAPTASRIGWIAAAALPKVPVDVAATGPRVIGIAAKLADRITFAVGSDPERVGWAIEHARAAAPGSRLPLGAYLPVVVHEHRATARELVGGGVASFARFSVMHGAVTGPVSDTDRQALAAVHDRYDMHRHFTHGSPQSEGLPSETVDRFAVAGPPSYCVERLGELLELGLEKLVLLGGGIGMDRDAARASRQMLVEEVLPKLR